MNEISRRDFVKLTGAGIGVAAAWGLTSCDKSNSRDYESMLSRGEFVPKTFGYISEVGPDLIEKKDEHGRTGELRNSKEFMVRKGDKYTRLGPWGLMTLPGDTNSEFTWQKLKERNLNGPELFMVWESEGKRMQPGELEAYENLKPLPALELALSKNIEIFPDIRYALCDIQEIGGSNGKYRYVFNPNKARYILDNFPNIVGFTIDEPWALETEDLWNQDDIKLGIDWLTFLSEYSITRDGLPKGVDLPINIVNFGKRYADPEDDIRWISQILLQQAAAEGTITLDNNYYDKNPIRIIGGNFYYELNALFGDEENSTNNILARQREAYQLEYQDSKSGRFPQSNWYVLPAHDEDPPYDPGRVEYNNYVQRAEEFYLPGEFKFDATKLYLKQIISAISNNPTYTRFLFWNFPDDSDIKTPYDSAMDPIDEIMKKLFTSSNYFAGKDIDQYTKNGSYSYSVKEIVALNPDNNQYENTQAIFIDTENGEFPSKLTSLLSPGKYIDEITDIVIEIDGFGKVVEIPINIPVNTVFAFVPAE